MENKWDVFAFYNPFMNRKFAFLSGVLFLASALSFAQEAKPAVAPTVAPAAAELSATQKETVLKAIETTLTERAFVPGIDFKQWSVFLEKKKEDIDKAVNPTDFARVVNTALRDFGISHTRLQTPKQAVARNKTTAIGSGMNLVSEEKGLRVRRVAEGSPAKLLGIEEKDLITLVNGVLPTNADVVTGEKGAIFKLQVEKSNGEKKEYELELKEFSTIRKETLTWFGEDTAVLRVYTFSAGYGRENIEGLMVEATKAKNLILDLRSNGGGAVNNLNHLLSLLMPVGTEYGAFISKKMANEFAAAKPDATVTPEAIAEWTTNKAKTRKGKVDFFKGKIAVLTNRGSGSASEICAASLREMVSAKIVGTPSAGAVLASVFRPLPEGFAIQIPISDYITQKGVRIEKNPVKPDYEVTAVKKDGEPDPVIEKAVEILKNAYGL
jgi:carboxyl-terminal processing protease